HGPRPGGPGVAHAQGREELRDQPPTTRTHHTRDAPPSGARGTARPALHTPAPGHRRVATTAEGRPRGSRNCAPPTTRTRHTRDARPPGARATARPAHTHPHPAQTGDPHRGRPPQGRGELRKPPPPTRTPHTRDAPTTPPPDPKSTRLNSSHVKKP